LVMTGIFGCEYGGLRRFCGLHNSFNLGLD